MIPPACRARQFHLFPGNSRPPRIRHRGAARDSARPAGDCGRGTARFARRCLPANAGAAAGDVGDSLSGSARTTSAAIYVPVEPCDPFTEAVRTALEIDAEVIFIEPDSGDRPHLPDTYPDPYSIRYIGLNRYIDAYRVYPQPRNEETAAHAAGMAWKLQGADPLAQVLVVVSLNLLDPVLDAMEVPQDAPAPHRVARHPAAEPASRLPGRDHHRISVPARPLRIVSDCR